MGRRPENILFDLFSSAYLPMAGQRSDGFPRHPTKSDNDGKLSASVAGRILVGLLLLGTVLAIVPWSISP